MRVDFEVLKRIKREISNLKERRRKNERTKVQTESVIFQYFTIGIRK